MATSEDVSHNETVNGHLLSPEEQNQLTEALKEFEMWKSKVDKADTEKSRLLLEKLDTEESKKIAQKETMDLLEQQKKISDASLQQKKALQESILLLEKNNQALKEQLKEYEDMLKNKRAEHSALQQRFKVKADIPDMKVKFTGVRMEGEEVEENVQDIVSVFTITQKPSFQLRGGQALITFEENKVAENILKLPKCSVTFDKGKMDVKPYQVTLDRSVKFEVHMNVSKKKICFFNAPPYLPDERMRDRLEISFSKPSQGGGEVEEVVYNKDTGSGEVTFLNTGAAEHLVLKKKYIIDTSREIDVHICPHYKYQLKQFQTYCGVPKRTILLGGIEDVLEEEDLQDHLEIHFQKPSNYGGEVESIKYISGRSTAEAYFSEETAETEA
ncbi:hypothetical protein JZ751_027838 [Albula glossodonta]|uniref:NID domain-containing protein n=1 Tax=Albula glossodonta TaxID=121402 RepID=A0A8T2PA26_9TELE|nr:hypothetical protein JZ751_027838 [Albula glossodonta]